MIIEARNMSAKVKVPTSWEGVSGRFEKKGRRGGGGTYTGHEEGGNHGSFVQAESQPYIGTGVLVALVADEADGPVGDGRLLAGAKVPQADVGLRDEDDRIEAHEHNHRDGQHHAPPLHREHPPHAPPGKLAIIAGIELRRQVPTCVTAGVVIRGRDSSLRSSSRTLRTPPNHIADVEPDTEARGEQLQRRAHATKGNQPTKPRRERMPLIRHARRSQPVRNSRNAECEAEEERREPYPRHYGDPEEGPRVLEVPADAQVRPEGPEHDPDDACHPAEHDADPRHRA